MITTSRNYLKNKPSFSQVLPQTDKKKLEPFTIQR